MRNKILAPNISKKNGFFEVFIKIHFSICCLFLLFGIHGFSADDAMSYCGGGDWNYEDEYYQILDSSLLTDPSLSSFLYCPEYLFCDADENELSENQNILEWKEYLASDLTIEEVKLLIYGSTSAQIEVIISGNSLNYQGSLNKVKKDKKERFLQYLLFAKRNQRIQSGKETYNSWYQGEGKNPNALDKEELLSEAFELYRNENDVFIKNRYAFQIIRLCHYLGKNEEALLVFDTYLTYKNAPDYIFYRALEQKAGALYNLKKFKESTISFLKVYKELPDRRETCASSLRLLLSKKETSNVIAHSLEKEYQEIFGFFNVFYGSTNELSEAERLASINPDSPYLELILMRTLEQLQYDLFNIQAITLSDSYRYFGKANYDARYISRLEEIVENQLNNSSLKDINLWKIYLGFLKIYKKEMEAARTILSEIPQQSEYFSQAQRLMFVSKTLSMPKEIDRIALDQLYQQTKTNTHLDIHCYNFFINQTALLYKNNQNKILAILMSHEKEYLIKRDYLSEVPIEAFQQFLDIVDKTEFEQHLLSLLPSKNPQDYINEMRGTMFFRANQLERAVIQYQSLEKAGDYYEEGIRSMVFSGAIREFFDVPFEEQSDRMDKKYPHFFSGKEMVTEYYNDNKLILAKTLLKIEAEASIRPEKAGEYYYMLGNAWYNLSERGWFPNALNYFYNDSRYELFYYDITLDQLDDYSAMQHADAYYKKALNASVDNEIKAKATFMLAKIHPCYDIYGDYKNYQFELCKDHLSYFEILSKKYADTEFVDEVIAECSYYRHYLN